MYRFAATMSTRNHLTLFLVPQTQQVRFLQPAKLCMLSALCIDTRSCCKGRQRNQFA